MSAPTLRAPALRRDGDEFRFEWPDCGVGVTVSHVYEAHRDLFGEFLFQTLDGGHLHLTKMRLLGGRRAETVRILNGRANGFDWNVALEQVCTRTALAWRAGEPSVELVPSDEPLRHAVDRLLVADEVNEWHADGGSLKSYTALAIALAITRQVPLPCGLEPRICGPVMYLDYESNRPTHERRLGALMRGLGLTGPSGIFYRSPARPLMDDAAAVRAEAVRLGAVLTVVDSFSRSIGGVSMIDAATPTMNALGSLPGTKLLLNHVAKAFADQRGPTRALGTVTMMNGPRNAWELKAEEDEGDTRTVGFYHAKTNDTRRYSPFALRYAFSETAAGVLTARIAAGDLDESPSLAARMSLSARLLAALRGGERTVEALAAETDAPANQVRARLNALKRSDKVVRLDNVRNGLWGLRHE